MSDRPPTADDVQSILKICPMAEEDAIRILARLLDRQVIELR